MRRAAIATLACLSALLAKPPAHAVDVCGDLKPPYAALTDALARDGHLAVEILLAVAPDCDSVIAVGVESEGDADADRDAHVPCTPASAAEPAHADRVDAVLAALSPGTWSLLERRDDQDVLLVDITDDALAQLAVDRRVASIVAETDIGTDAEPAE